MKKLIALVLALAMVATLGLAFADENSSHVITITNTDQNVAHTYEAYQVFKGKLSADGTKLSDIVWGNGVKAADLVTALKSTTAASLSGVKTAVADIDVTNATQLAGAAAIVANAISGLSSTNATATTSAAAIDDFAAVIAANLNTKAADFAADTADTTGKTYKATVTGDGYYFVKDVTSNLTGTTGSDTLSKYLLNVVKNITVQAKDTHLTPEKKIVEGSARVDENSAAVGDTVTFEVKIKVPNTKKYINKFLFDMQDTLPIGLTFTGISSVKVGEDDVSYTLTVDDAAYAAPTDPVNADAPSAGQVIKLEFPNFKAFAEADGKNRIGADMIITYTAVVNKNADFTPTGNINTVKFDYSNDPNHNYTGEEPNPPMGVTPEDHTKTLLINLEITKTGDNGATTALAGAEFEITSSDYNVTLVTGEKFTTEEAGSGETLISAGWYKLSDGSYTQTAPTDETRASYDNPSTTYNKIAYSNSVVTPSGTPKKVTVITNESGKISLKGLKPGTYQIKETKAPTGYNLDPNTYTVKINWDGTTKVFSKHADSSEGVTFDGTTATAKITIDNKSGTTLPSTGGIGTTIFYIVGGLLVIGAAVILVARRKAHE